MDKIKPEARSQNMRQIRAVNTKPELRVRSLLHRMGLRFRLHLKYVPGKPDIVLPRHGKVIFVHGCFWHQHSKCRAGRIPLSRQDYWIPKLARNVQRDAEHQRKLRSLGWKPLVIWECELGDIERIKKRLAEFFA